MSTTKTRNRIREVHDSSRTSPRWARWDRLSRSSSSRMARRIHSRIYRRTSRKTCWPRDHWVKASYRSLACHRMVYPRRNFHKIAIWSIINHRLKVCCLRIQHTRLTLRISPTRRQVQCRAKAAASLTRISVEVVQCHSSRCAEYSSTDQHTFISYLLKSKIENKASAIFCRLQKTP